MPSSSFFKHLWYPLGISQEKNKLKKFEQGIPKISTFLIPPCPPIFLVGIAKKKKLPMFYAMSHP